MDQLCQVCHGEAGTKGITCRASDPGKRLTKRVSASRSRFEKSRSTLLVNCPRSTPAWSKAHMEMLRGEQQLSVNSQEVVPVRAQATLRLDLVRDAAQHRVSLYGH